MSDSTLNQLKNQVSNLNQSESKLQTLTDAFQTFTVEAKRLEKEYKILKKRFTQVNVELEDTNKELKSKVLQLNYITSYLNNILSNIQQGLLFVDLSGTIITINPAAESILGKSAEKLKYKNYEKALGEKGLGFPISEHLKLQKEIPSHRFTYPIKNQPSKELEISTSFVGKGPVSQHGLIILIKDISELCHLQVINSRNDRLKDLGEMAARVAHEIRNPLGGIEGFATLLQRDLETLPQAKTMAEHILSGTKIISRLVSGILDYSKPLQPNLTPCELHNLIQKGIDMVKVDKRFNSTHSLKFQPLESSLTLSLDPQLILTALWNLLINASESMEKKGSITLSLHTDSSWAIIKIKDKGKGIPSSHLEKIFSPLFTSKQTGNGLGLSEVYKIIQLHGGDIEVQSKVAKGTTFCIKLPIHTQQQVGS